MRSIGMIALALASVVSPSASPSVLDVRIEKMIDRMTVRERAAQLLVVGFSGTRVNSEIRRLVHDWRVGAIAIYSRNVNTPAQLRSLTAEIRALAPDGVAPLIAVDQEGGEVARIGDGVPRLPGQMALGATRSPELARRAGRALGASLAALGVTLNLAPVVDVAEARSPIGIRAFADDAALTGTLGAAFIRGQREGGIASTAKHFPGIGFAPADSHDQLPVVSASLQDLRRIHFAPIRAAIDAGVDAVMVGHVAVPAIDGQTPATLSPAIIALLRDDLRFDGVVITDALEMGALDRSDGIGRLAVRSVHAGADLVMVLWHQRDREEVLDALEAACRSGELSDARVRQSLRRILRLKLRLPARHVVADTTIADDIARASLTLLRNEAGLVPLRGGDGLVYIGPEGPLADTLHTAKSVQIPPFIPPERAEAWAMRAREAAAGASVIIGVAQNLGQLAVIRAAHEAWPAARVILVSLGSPQLINDFPQTRAYICAYGYLAPSQHAAAALLVGAARPRGRLPVAVPPLFAAGDGIIDTKAP
ncbi:MAG TPA: glycoside hydrolase family 3 protein [Thermoanaerobaculia bacterium]|nr:glycoside hydrolase family 3 protein [Thermoanaerobaculia bacterium]